MKIFRISLLFIVIVLFGCGNELNNLETSYTIRITGSENLKFSGHYSFVGTGSVPKPIKIEAVVPAEYKGNGLAAVCVFRKTTAEGLLKVEILKDGKVVSDAETLLPFGVISLGKAPNTDSIINKILGMILG